MTISNKWSAIMLTTFQGLVSSCHPWHGVMALAEYKRNQSSPIALCASGLGGVLGLHFHKGANSIIVDHGLIPMTHCIPCLLSYLALWEPPPVLCLK
jgi:hypothetical protein